MDREQGIWYMYKKEKTEITFKEWIEKLEKINPFIDWNLMTETTITELKAAHKDIIEREERG